MDKIQEHHETESTASPEKIVISPESTSSPVLGFIKIALILLIIAACSLGAYYLGAKGYKISIQTPEKTDASNQTNPTSIQPQTDNAIITQPQMQITVKPQITVQQIRACTLAAGAGSTLFTSNNFHICFLHAIKGSAVVPQVAINTQENANTIYVYATNTQPSSGQSVEVFNKEPGDDIKQAITKRFLQGINANDCFVKISPNGNLPANFVKATIGYPIPQNADQPNWTYGENCPENYKESNGIAYFLMDKNHPDRLFYFSIGQYGIEASTGNQNRLWQDTIQVF
jgi:hypothetical protein